MLHVLKQQHPGAVQGLLTTTNEAFDRVAMHAVRRSLLEAQARAAGVPLHVVPLPWPCSNEQYEARMGAAVRTLVEDGFTHVAFGDLFLEDVRRYREDRLAGTGLTPLFPLWKTTSTAELAREMIDGGLEARLTCVDPRVLDRSFAGRRFDARPAARPARERGPLRRARRVPLVRVCWPDVLRTHCGDTGRRRRSRRLRLLRPGRSGAMKQTITGAVLGLGGWLATATVISLVLQARGGGGWIDTLGVSLMSGLLAWASVGLFYSAIQRWREQSVISGGVAGVRPVNGNRAVLVGTLEPAGIGPALRAPFDGSECLTYAYEVSEDRGTGRRRTVFTHMKGVALVPSMIVTRTGSYRLLAVPRFEGDEPRIPREEIIANLERYVRTTTFTTRDTSAQELTERWNDADGAYRSDVSYTDLDPGELPAMPAVAAGGPSRFAGLRLRLLLRSGERHHRVARIHERHSPHPRSR